MVTDLYLAVEYSKTFPEFQTMKQEDKVYTLELLYSTVSVPDQLHV